MTGLELVQRADGEIGRGGIYTLLGRLADKGLVESRTVPPPQGKGGMPRRLFVATGTGQRVVEALGVTNTDMSEALPV